MVSLLMALVFLAGPLAGVVLEKKFERSLEKARIPQKAFIGSHPDKASLCRVFFPSYLLIQVVTAVLMVILLNPKFDGTSRLVYFFIGFLPFTASGALIGIYELYFHLSPANVRHQGTFFAHSADAQTVGKQRIALFGISLLLFVLALSVETHFFKITRT